MSDGMTGDKLCAMSRDDLAHTLARGRAFACSEVAGSIYRGISLGLPAWIDRLAWKKFAKAFDVDGTRGWNLRIEQDALDQPWRPKRRAGAPVTFGPFAVAADGGGVILDYSIGRGPLCALRDPIVALDERADLLLGRSLVAIGGRRFGTPSYFVLERGLGPPRSADPRGRS